MGVRCAAKEMRGEAARAEPIGNTYVAHEYVQNAYKTVQTVNLNGIFRSCKHNPCRISPQTTDAMEAEPFSSYVIEK
jgi:hypothetical protein